MSYLATRNISGSVYGDWLIPDELKIMSLPRLLGRGEGVSRSDADALRRYERTGEVPYGYVTEEMIVNHSVRNGIIVGEGDSGKTWLADRLVASSKGQTNVCVVPLRLYGNDLARMEEDVLSSIGLRSSGYRMYDSSHCGPSVVIFDGLDENPDAWKAIERLCKERLLILSQISVWVTSRPRDEVRELEQCLNDVYHLVPFSANDLSKLAAAADLDGEAFVRALKELELLGLAAKPGCAVLFLNLFRDDKLSSDRAQLMNGIVETLVMNSRDGRVGSVGGDWLPVRCLLEDAAWMATRLFFAQKEAIWVGIPCRCPYNALPLGDLTVGEYEHKELVLLLGRRLFEPLAEDLFRFVADDPVVPYLTAWWLNRKGNGHFKDLFETRFGIGDALSTVMNWLSRLDPDQAKGWIDLAPDLFLECPQAIEKYGESAYYGALFEEFMDWTLKDRMEFVYSCLDFRPNLVKLSKLDGIAHGVLRNDESSSDELCLAAALLACTRSPQCAADAFVHVFARRNPSGADRHLALRVLAAFRPFITESTLGLLEGALHPGESLPERDEGSVSGKSTYVTAQRLKVLQEQLKSDPYNEELRDEYRWIKRKYVAQLPPKLVHPEILDAWAGVKGVTVPVAKQVRGKRNSNHRRIQREAVLKYLAGKELGPLDLTSGMTDHLWKLHADEWDAWVNDPVDPGYKDYYVLTGCVKQEYQNKFFKSAPTT